MRNNVVGIIVRTFCPVVAQLTTFTTFHILIRTLRTPLKRTYQQLMYSCLSDTYVLCPLRLLFLSSQLVRPLAMNLTVSVGLAR